MYKYSQKTNNGVKLLGCGILHVVVMGCWGLLFAPDVSAGHLPFPDPNPIASVPASPSTGFCAEVRLAAVPTIPMKVAGVKWSASWYNIQKQDRMGPRHDTCAILYSRRDWDGLGRG